MNKKKHLPSVLICFALCLAAVPAALFAAGVLSIEESGGVEGMLEPGTYTEEGADTCIKCHDEDDEYPVFDIFKTKHAFKGDKRSPFAGLQCEACHGPGIGGPDAIAEIIEKGGHTGRVRRGDERPPILSFGTHSKDPVEKQNRMCTKCHSGDDHVGWQGSAHQGADVACASCHKLHVDRDPVLEKRTQAPVCYTCHLKQRLDFAKPSAHPVRFGLVSCGDCHQPHGSIADALLVKPTLNQTCYTCHADKRGPVLWEHAPVSEDCGLCHEPHGSIHPAMLNKRAPLLCQQCHSQNGHPSVAYSGSGLAGGASPTSMLLGRSCVNCHVQVHGSNHPSGVKLMR
jgi:DmsE family decaheme c-type cytochrome